MYIFPSTIIVHILTLYCVVRPKTFLIQYSIRAACRNKPTGLGVSGDPCRRPEPGSSARVMSCCCELPVRQVHWHRTFCTLGTRYGYSFPRLRPRGLLTLTMMRGGKRRGRKSGDTTVDATCAQVGEGWGKGLIRPSPTSWHLSWMQRCGGWVVRVSDARSDSTNNANPQAPHIFSALRSCVPCIVR